MEDYSSGLPMIMALLNESKADLRKAGADALMKFSERAEFRDSIRLAIPQIITLLDSNDSDVRAAGVATLSNLSDQGVNADTSYNTIDSNQSTHFETITCWIAAEHALQHARSKAVAVSQVFSRSKIEEHEFVVLAGFDESLIKSGIGYLEQIHVFVSAEVDATSSLLSELGKIFSPFSSILFTESSSHHIPVFKDDGNIWEFDELVYFAASQFSDDGLSAKMPLTVISLSQTPSRADGLTNFSHAGSGSGEGERNEKRWSRKGKERDRGEEDEGDTGDKNDEDPDNGPEEPPRNPKSISRLISFDVTSNIHLAEDEQNAFQTLNLEGELTIETTPHVASLHKFSKRRVEFTTLIFDTKPTPTSISMGIAYRQFHIRVVVDSQQETARVSVEKPKRSPSSDGEEKQTVSKKSGYTRGVTGGVSALPHAQAAIALSALKTDEETTGFERKRYTSRIIEHHHDGVVQWSFDVDDKNVQQMGFAMPKEVLPTASFKFIGDSHVLPPPERMDIVIASYWSIIPPNQPRRTWIQKFLHFFRLSGIASHSILPHSILPSKPRRSWIHKFLHLFRSSGKSQAMSYSNLFQVVALKTVPSNLPESSFYIAKVKVRSGASDPPEVKMQAPSSVDVTPAVVNDLRNVSILNLPTISKLKLSDNCVKRVSENWVAIESD